MLKAIRHHAFRFIKPNIIPEQIEMFCQNNMITKLLLVPIASPTFIYCSETVTSEHCVTDLELKHIPYIHQIAIYTFIALGLVHLP